MKKVLTLFLVIILALTFITPVFAGNNGNGQGNGNDNKSDEPTIDLTRTAAKEIVELKTHQLTYNIDFEQSDKIPKQIIVIKNYKDPVQFNFDYIAKTYYSTQTEDFDQEFSNKTKINYINFDSKKSLEQQFNNAQNNSPHLKYIVFLDEDNTKNEDILNNIKDQVEFKLDTYTKLHYNILDYDILELANPNFYVDIANDIKKYPVYTGFEFEEVLPVEVKTVKSNNPKLTITKNAEGRFVVKGELDVATTNFTIDVTYHYQYFKVTYNDENSRLTVNYAGQAYIKYFDGLTVNIKHIIDVQ